jgi:hypothetical protein
MTIALLDPLSYLIGGDDRVPLNPGRMYELSYDATRGDTAYCNLRDEKSRFRNLAEANERGPYRPYLPPDDITQQYGEYCPDPRNGDGFIRNVVEQIWRKHHHGCRRVEFDNPDTWLLDLTDVLIAHSCTAAYGLTTVAKNPVFVDDPELYLSHPSIDMAICEHASEQGSDVLDSLRRAVGKPMLAVRFVAYVDADEDGTQWAMNVAENIRARGYSNMGVTLSRRGEYTGVEDLQLPLV